jgi:hypothetical protein
MQASTQRVIVRPEKNSGYRITYMNGKKVQGKKS